MRARGVIVVFVLRFVLVVLVMVLGVAGVASAVAPVQIEGVVTDAVTGLPLTSVSVSAVGLTPGALSDGEGVDADGRFRFVNLTPGDYIVSFFADDYIIEWYADVLDPTLATVITVTEEGTVTGIDAALEYALPRIVGHVYDESTGLPIPGVSVGADGPTPDGEVSYADGRFEFRRLDPGDYAVSFFSDDHFMEWYDDVYSADAATPVAFGPGTTLMPDVYLLPLGVYGRVVNERTGEPIVGAAVSVVPPVPRAGITSRSGITSRDGSFAVLGFGWPDWGSYAVFVSAPGFKSEWYDDAQATRRATLVDIRPQAMPNDLQIALRPFRGRSVRGPWR